MWSALEENSSTSSAHDFLRRNQRLGGYMRGREGRTRQPWWWRMSRICVRVFGWGVWLSRWRRLALRLSFVFNSRMGPAPTWPTCPSTPTPTSPRTPPSATSPPSGSSAWAPWAACTPSSSARPAGKSASSFGCDMYGQSPTLLIRIFVCDLPENYERLKAEYASTS